MRSIFRNTGPMLAGMAIAVMPATASAQEWESYEGENRPAEEPISVLDRHLTRLAAIWPGEYDNIEQLFLDRALRGEARSDNSENRTYSRIERIDASDLGDHVFAISEYRGDDRETPFRKRIYAVTTDVEANGLRIAQYEEDSAGSANLLTGCDLIVRRKGDFFEGALESSECAHDPSDYAFKLWADQYWSKSAAIGDGAWRHMEKARRFTCMIDFPREPGGFPGVTHHYISIHDQGGEFDFVHPDGRAMKLIMQNTWSEGMYRETFVIGVLDKDYSGPTLVYAWADSESDWIGMNPMWIRVQCDLDTEQNRQLQLDLRPTS